MTPHRLVRLYPRAWRERYGDEFAALLEQSDRNWRVGLDVLRGAAREWARDLSRPADGVGLSLRRLLLRNLARLFSSVLTAWLIVSAAWPVAGALHALGLTFYAAWVPILRLSLFGRVLLCGQWSWHQPARWPIGNRELGLWLTFAFISSVMERLSGLNRPYTFEPYPATQLDAMWVLWPCLAVLFAATRGAARDLSMYLEWRRRRWQTLTAGPLGLNRD